MTDKVSSELWFADKIAKFSKDQSTKVGAAIFNENESSPLSYGYNGLPRGLDDDNPLRNERPEKYFWYEHAERNAIYNVARSILSGKVIFCSHFPNMESARGIVSSGISNVIVENTFVELEHTDTKRVLELFKETKVNLITPDLSKYHENFDMFCTLNEFPILHKSSDQSIDKIKDKTRKIYKNLHSQMRKYSNYLNLVKEYAEEFSPDREKKSGCLILDAETYVPIATGVNSPPHGIKITEEMHGENKNFWFQEAEKNAIFTAVTPKLQNSHFQVSWCPCIKCALSIVSVKASKVSTRAPDFTKEEDLRWKTDFDQSQKLFDLAGVEMNFISSPIVVQAIKMKK